MGVTSWGGSLLAILDDKITLWLCGDYPHYLGALDAG